MVNNVTTKLAERTASRRIKMIYENVKKIRTSEQMGVKYMQYSFLSPSKRFSHMFTDKTLEVIKDKAKLVQCTVNIRKIKLAV